MNKTHNTLNIGILDCLPSAKAIPIGSENEIPVTPSIKVSIIPPNLSVGTVSKPKPPKSNHPATNGNIAEYISPYFLLGSFRIRLE